MKKKILPIVIILFLFGGIALAQETELPDPGMTPDSPFYFLETIIEDIGTFFTFGDLKKAERHAVLAAERIAEAKDMMEKGKLESVEKSLERYRNQLNKSMAMAEKAMNEGKDFEKVMESIAQAGKATSVHLEVLAEVYDKVPEEAKTAVENAMAVSVKRHEKAVEALKSSNHLGEVPEEVPISTNIPQEARERIQTRVQQELDIERVIRNIEPSESVRDLCVKSGGPSEICDKLPSQNFKSFKQIETFCTEAGGPSEVCGSIESMCKEFGVTNPDECFRVMMISTVTTYNSAELKTVPVPVRGE